MSAHARHARELRPWMYFIPALTLVIAVTFYPSLAVIWLSFQRTAYWQSLGFAGLSNYVQVVYSQSFFQEAKNTVVYVEASLVFAIVIGLAAAIFLQTLAHARRILRTILLMPWALSMGVIGVLWTWLLNPSYGPVAYVMHRVGFGASLLLGDPRLAMPLLILITVWWSFPFAMVMTSAAIEGIPRDFYEAVDLDGGGPMAGFRCVTWPFVAPTIRRCALVLSILFLTLVTLILVVTGGGPLGRTATWSLEAFRSGVRDANVARASVLSVFVLGANLVLGFFHNRFGSTEL
jgi:multiple sugar transport system permease protein